MAIVFIIITLLVSIAIFHLLTIIAWFSEDLQLYNYFRSSKTALLFFIPLIGGGIMIYKMAKKRMKEDFFE